MVTGRAVGALVAVTCTALAGCTTTGADAPKWSPDGAAERTAEWSVTPSDQYGPIVTAQAVDSHIVVVFERRVAVLDRRNGKQRWSVAAAFPNNLQPAEDSVRVTPDALVLLQESDDRDEPGTVTVYDLASGEHRATLEYGNLPDYRSSGRGRVAVTADAVLAQKAEPTGSGADERHTLESVDLKTGRSLWKRDYGALFPLIERAAQGSSNPYFLPPPRDPLLAPASTRVVLRGYEEVNDQHEYRTRVVDPRTGRTVGRPGETPQNSGVSLLDDERYVVWDDDAEGCDAQVTGYDAASAKPSWRLEAAVWHNVTRPKCVDTWEPLIVEDRLLTHTPDERPMLVDPADGKPAWTGPAGFYPIGASGDVVVGRDSRKNNTVVAYDISGSRPLWSGPDPGAIQNESDTVVPGYAILTAGAHEVWTYQITTGRKVRCEGDNRVIGAGDGWLIAGLKGDLLDDGKSALRYFRL